MIQNCSPPPSVYNDNNKEDEISDEIRQLFLLITHDVLTLPVCLFGIIANVINIVIFLRQGLRQTSNISFVALACSDLLTLISLAWLVICLYPHPDFQIVLRETSYLSAAWPNTCFASITCGITVFITAERCLCVGSPLKAHQIITRRRARLVLACIYSSILLTTCPVYATLYFEWKFNSLTNTTILTLMTRKHGETVEDVISIFFAGLWLLFFFSAIFLTICLVQGLRQTAKWRINTAGDVVKADAIKNREKRSMVMAIAITCILIVCFSPSVCLLVVGYTVDGFARGGKYSNLYFVSWSVALLFEAVNSSVNILIYYNLRSNFRQTCHDIFASSSHSRLRKN